MRRLDRAGSADVGGPHGAIADLGAAPANRIGGAVAERRCVGERDAAGTQRGHLGRQPRRGVGIESGEEIGEVLRRGLTGQRAEGVLRAVGTPEKAAERRSAEDRDEPRAVLLGGIAGCLGSAEPGTGMQRQPAQRDHRGENDYGSNQDQGVPPTGLAVSRSARNHPSFFYEIKTTPRYR